MRNWVISLLMIGTFLLFQFAQKPAFDFMFPLFTKTGITAVNQANALTAAVLLTSAGMIIVLFLLARMNKDFWKIFDEPRASAMNIIKWGIFGFLLAMVAQIINNLITVQITGEVKGSENTALLLDQFSLSPWFALTIVVVAPLTEEFVFRRAIFGELYNRVGFFIAATISGLLFAVAHMDFTHILSYLFVAYIFAYTYVKTRSIWTPIIAHFLMNGFVVLSAYLAMKFAPDALTTISFLF